tara:strand:+ start:2964 stop:3239 length:276 start_codon:yes stop_codon:yes gene_type:complete
MKIENITIEKAHAALLDGDSIDHGFGGEYDFSDVISSADISVLLMNLAGSVNDPAKANLDNALLATAKRIAMRLNVAMYNIEDELVESWDE